MIFKGISPKGINGREMFETGHKMVAIWAQYYRVLGHYGRMQVHHGMIQRHDLDRAQAFAAEEARFLRALAELQLLLNENFE